MTSAFPASAALHLCVHRCVLYDLTLTRVGRRMFFRSHSTVCAKHEVSNTAFLVLSLAQSFLMGAKSAGLLLLPQGRHYGHVPEFAPCDQTVHRRWRFSLYFHACGARTHVHTRRDSDGKPHLSRLRLILLPEVYTSGATASPPK